MPAFRGAKGRLPGDDGASAAEKDGFTDAMMLDYRGYIAESTGSNVFFVKDGVIHTPLPDCFLNGITRQSLKRLCEERGIKFIERPFTIAEALAAPEMFVTSASTSSRPRRVLAWALIIAHVASPSPSGVLRNLPVATGRPTTLLTYSLRNTWCDECDV